MVKRENWKGPYGTNGELKKGRYGSQLYRVVQIQSNVLLMLQSKATFLNTKYYVSA